MSRKEFEAVRRLWRVLGAAQFLGLHGMFLLGGLAAGRLPKTGQRAVGAAVVFTAYFTLGRRMTRYERGGAATPSSGVVVEVVGHRVGVRGRTP